ncbi:hypothetical protein OIE68_13015 [Nocardia vinacea]|uniref:Uncharacterized protein n=1 Tax=Nocardia vinacea TaxID=96468 RepID=A0ABZ1YX06_9NOCA|nr:hypothetical protein OIE68_13015 [Nocardia vinacea]
MVGIAARAATSVEPETDSGPIFGLLGRGYHVDADSAELAAYGSKTLIDGGLIGNDTDGVIGSFDEARVQRVIDEFAPILRRGGADIPNNLRAEDIVTKEFLDPTINVGS